MQHGREERIRVRAETEKRIRQARPALRPIAQRVYPAHRRQHALSKIEALLPELQALVKPFVGRKLDIAGLNEAAGFIRNGLFKRLQIHTVPTLHFTFDRTTEHAAELSALIREANSTRAKED